MGLDNMRGGYGRCSPLLAGGLLVMCFILVFNWWSLSSQNYELLQQLQDLSEQLKISSDEQDLCIRQKQALESRTKFAEDELAKLRVQIELTRKENEDLKKTIENKEQELRTLEKNEEEVQGSADRCNAELESLKKLDQSKDDTMESLRLEKDHASLELKELKQTVEQLRSELVKAQAELPSPKISKESKIPQSKTVSATQLRAGELPPMTSFSAVEVRSTGLSGMAYHHGVPILPSDPPNAYRPPPRFSVTQLKRRKEQPVTIPDNMAVGGDHEVDKQLEAEENNNAKEEHDEADVPVDLNADTNQIGEPEQRMEVAEDDGGAA